MTASNGVSSHWAGMRAPISVQTVGVKAVTQRKSSNFSGKFMTCSLKAYGLWLMAYGLWLNELCIMHLCIMNYALIIMR